MIAIDKNVPVPPRIGGRPGGRPTKYPWLDMEIGDSFRTSGKRNSIGAAVAWATKQYGRKFVTRREDDGVRIWRIA